MAGKILLILHFSAHVCLFIYVIHSDRNKTFSRDTIRRIHNIYIENGERQRESESSGKEREETGGENEREIIAREIERVFSFEVSRVHGVDEEREADEGTFREQTSESGNACGVQRRGVIVECM